VDYPIDTFLNRLAEGAAGEEWAELASDVVHGRTTLAQAGASGAYRELFETAWRDYQAWDAALEPDERARVLREAREALGIDASRIDGGDP